MNRVMMCWRTFTRAKQTSETDIVLDSITDDMYPVQIRLEAAKELGQEVVYGRKLVEHTDKCSCCFCNQD